MSNLKNVISIGYHLLAINLIVGFCAIQGSNEQRNIHDDLIDLFHSSVEVETHDKQLGISFQRLRSFKEEASQLFGIRFARNYTPEELEMRQDILLKRFLNIKAENEAFKRGEISYKMKINEFADWTDAEIRQLSGAIVPERFQIPESGVIPNELVTINDNSLPINVSWIDYFRPARHQGKCGSCYAFATVDTMMAAKSIAESNKQIEDFSVQQLVDCGTKLGYVSGCKGGWPDKAINYFQQSRGIATEADYPYEAQQNNCKLNPDQNITLHPVSADSVWGLQFTFVNGESAMRYHLAKYGPLIAVHRMFPNAALYHEGIYETNNCTGTLHAVSIVGYGTEGGVDYWQIRNSWGSDWGANGHMKMVRRKNMCDIERIAYGILKQD